jgi:hypothetical protein
MSFAAISDSAFLQQLANLAKKSSTFDPASREFADWFLEIDPMIVSPSLTIYA